MSWAETKRVLHELIDTMPNSDAEAVSTAPVQERVSYKNRPNPCGGYSSWASGKGWVLSRCGAQAVPGYGQCEYCCTREREAAEYRRNTTRAAQ